MRRRPGTADPDPDAPAVDPGDTPTAAVQEPPAHEFPAPGPARREPLVHRRELDRPP